MQNTPSKQPYQSPARNFLSLFPFAAMLIPRQFYLPEAVLYAMKATATAVLNFLANPPNI